MYNRNMNMKKLTPMKAIRAKCIECGGGSFVEVRMCPVKECPLYAYRSGHRPKDDKDSTEAAEDEKMRSCNGRKQQKKGK